MSIKTIVATGMVVPCRNNRKRPNKYKSSKREEYGKVRISERMG